MKRSNCGSAHLSVHNVVTVLFSNDIVNFTHFSAVDFNNRHIKIWLVKKKALEFGAILCTGETTKRWRAGDSGERAW